MTSQAEQIAAIAEVEAHADRMKARYIMQMVSAGRANETDIARVIGNRRKEGRLAGVREALAVIEMCCEPCPGCNEGVNDLLTAPAILTAQGESK